VTDWPFKESPRYFFNLFNSTNDILGEQDFEIVSSAPTEVAGNPGFKFIIEYTSEEEQFLGLEEQQRTEAIVTTLMNGRMYTISYGSYSSQFEGYAQTFENIINSLEPILTPTSNLSHNQSTDGIALDDNDALNNNSKPNINNLSIRNTSDAQEGPVFSTYTDDKYGYSIKYPSNIGLGQPFALENANPNLVGNLFSFQNPSDMSEVTPNPADSAQVYVAAFYTNETDLMKRSILGAFLVDDTYFDDGSLASIASIASQELSLYKLLPSFVLLENVTTTINNYPAYSVEYKFFNPVYRSMLQTKSVYISDDDRLIVFQYYSSPSKFYDYLPIVQEMLNSLKFEHP